MACKPCVNSVQTYCIFTMQTLFKLFFLMGVNFGQTLCKQNIVIVILRQFFVTCRITKHQKSQPRWFQQYSLINSQHLNDDFHDMQTMCKPKIVLSKPKSATCKLFSIHMQIPKSRWFVRVLQNPEPQQPILMGSIRASHSWFNPLKSLLRAKKSLRCQKTVSTVYITLPPMAGPQGVPGKQQMSAWVRRPGLLRVPRQGWLGHDL